MRANFAVGLHAGAALVAEQSQDHGCNRLDLPRSSRGLLGSRLGSEFLPALEEGNLWIRAAMPPTISLEAGMPIVNKIREMLLKHPEVDHRRLPARPAGQRQRRRGLLQCRILRAAQAVRASGRPDVTKEKLIEELQKEFANEFVGIGFNFSQYIQDNVEEGLSGVKGANSVKIIGPDLAILERLAEQAMREMAQVRGVTDLGIFRVLGQPNLNIRVDRAKAARYGLNVNDVNAVVQAALGGTVATTLLEADRQFNVTVRLAPEYRNSLQSVGAIKVGDQTGNGQRLYSAERACHQSPSIPARPTSSASATNASFRSSSACAAAISQARLRKRRSGSQRT